MRPLKPQRSKQYDANVFVVCCLSVNEADSNELDPRPESRALRNTARKRWPSTPSNAADESKRPQAAQMDRRCESLASLVFRQAEQTATLTRHSLAKQL